MDTTQTPERLAPVALTLASVQWLFFMFANTVVIPLSVGQALHLGPAAITGTLARAFIYTGIACIAQATVGHRFPLMEGHAGLWWGTILGVAATVGASGTSFAVIGGSIAVGILGVSALIVLLALTGLGWPLRRLSTPVVTATFYFLLAAQLCQSFLKGALGIGVGPLQPGVAGIALGVMALTLGLNVWGPAWARNFALLAGIVAGWAVFALLLPHSVPAPVAAGRHIFDLFAWGAPAFDPGIIITVVLAGLISLSNSYVALDGAQTLLAQPAAPATYRRSLALTGLNGIVAGLFGLVPYAPYVSSLGFLRATRITDRRPFILGAAIFLLLGIVPPLEQLFAALPLSVGDAVLFIAYLQLFGSGVNALRGLELTATATYRVALPTLLGLAIMMTPATAFATLPALVRVLASNGLVLGIVVALALDALPWPDRAAGA